MPATLFKKETLVQVISCEFCEISNRRTPFLTEHSRHPVAVVYMSLVLLDVGRFFLEIAEIIDIHCVKLSSMEFFLVCIFPYSDWIRRYNLSLRIQSECGKIRTRKTPYLDTSRSDYTGSGRLEAFCKKCPEMFLKHRKQPCANVQKFRKIYTKTPALELHFNKAEV